MRGRHRTIHACRPRRRAARRRSCDSSSSRSFYWPRAAARSTPPTPSVRCARASAGDPAGFANHVDRAELVRTTEADGQKMEPSFATLDPGARAAARERFHNSMVTAIDDTFRIWEYDIKRGSASDLCHMAIVDSSEVGDTAHVRVRNPAEVTWRMARRGGRWLLVGAGD